MSKLGIWFNEREVYCDVNEDTTCHEIIQHLVKPPGTSIEKRQTVEDVTATEYKLHTELFAAPNMARYLNVCNSKVREDMNEQTHRQTLSSCYETRLRELSEWIDLVDSAIEVYNNSDVEDGLSEEEMIENQITRLGLLLKKQSAKCRKLLKKQQEESISQARMLQERLIKELEDKYGKMNYLDSQVNQMNSRLSLHKETLSLGLSKELEERLLEDSCSNSFTNTNQGITDSLISSPELLRKGLRSDAGRSEGWQLDTRSQSQVSSYNVDKITQHGGIRVANFFPRSEVENERGLLCLNTNVLSKEMDILTVKDKLTLTFGLEDEDTSVLV